MTRTAPRQTHYADTFIGTYVISVAAASVAETATYPLDLLKTRLQIQGEAAAVAANSVGKKLVCIKIYIFLSYQYEILMKSDVFCFAIKFYDQKNLVLSNMTDSYLIHFRVTVE